MLWCHVKHSVLFQSFILTLQCLGLPVKWTRCVWGLVYLRQQQALSLRSPVAIFMPSDWRLPGACHGSLQKHNDKNKYIQNKQAAGERGYRKSQACAQARRQKVMSQLSVVQSCKNIVFSEKWRHINSSVNLNFCGVDTLTVGFCLPLMHRAQTLKVVMCESNRPVSHSCSWAVSSTVSVYVYFSLLCMEC